MGSRPRPRRPPTGSGPSARPAGGRERGQDSGSRSWPPSLSLDRRSLSTTLDYTLGLALATVIITGLFIGASDFVGTQRERVVRTELGVIGEHVTDDITAADRLVEAGTGPTTVVVNQSLPRQVTGTPYRITIDVNGGDQWVNLSTPSPDVSVSIQFDTATPVAERAINGGEVSVVYTAGKLEVRS